MNPNLNDQNIRKHTVTYYCRSKGGEVEKYFPVDGVVVVQGDVNYGQEQNNECQRGEK
jgi:hypothetical protein